MIFNKASNLQYILIGIRDKCWSADLYASSGTVFLNIMMMSKIKRGGIT